jgi:DNA repair exonuclease SbcCD ATPase subunit
MSSYISKTKFLESSLGIINNIYHISDIHIRKRSRHDEYLEVFNRLIDLFNNHLDKYGRDFIIVITGDIMHDKSELVPESVDMLRQFLVMMSDITEVVMIIGNHDTNIFNKGSMDCITPIVSDLYTRYRIHLLNDNNIYLYGNNNNINTIIFGVTTLWATSVTKIEKGDLDDIEILANANNIQLNKNIIKIGLYHGMIHGCTLDNGMIQYSEENTNSTYFNQTDFDSYTYVMLGDVHKHQYLNKKKTIAYAGSLIQQKRDEDLVEHGTIKWNLETKTSEFIKIKNDYGMIQIKVGSNKSKIQKLKRKLTSEYDNSDIPKNLDIRIIYNSEEGKEFFKKIYSQIMKNYNIIKRSELTDTININGMNIDFKDMVDQYNDKTTDDNNIDKNFKINDNDSVKKIMMDHLTNYVDNTKKIHIESITKTQIRDEITDILNQIKYNFEREIKNIRLKSIEFNNMFVYTEKNKINFNAFKQLVGLNASNYQGKSSFIDIILYSIYGECSRGKRYDVLNINSKKMDSKIILEVNGIEYIISRISYVNSVSHRDLKESVIITENGKNITDDDRVKTRQIIEKKICSYDDMINNSFVLQKNGHSFVDLTDRQKKDLLCKMARLDIFDNIFIEAKSRHCSAGQTGGKLIKKLDQYELMIKDIKQEKSHNKLRLIDEAFIKKKKYTEKNIKILEESIIKIENKLCKLTDKNNKLNSQISIYDVQKNIYKNYDDEKENINKKSKNLVIKIQHVNNLKNEITQLLDGKSEAEIKDKKIQDVYNKKHILDNLNISLETNLKLLTNVKLIPNIHQKLKILENQINTKQLENLENIKQKSYIEGKIIAIQNEKNTFDHMTKLFLEKKLCLELADSYNKKSKQLKNSLSAEVIQLNKLETHEYNVNCNQCMKNPVTQLLLNTKTQIIDINNQIYEHDKLILENNNMIKTFCDHLDEQYYAMKKDFESLSEYDNRLEKITHLIQMNEKDIYILNQEKEKIIVDIEIISINTEIEKSISDIKQKISDNKLEISHDYDKILSIKKKINKIDNEIKSDICLLNELIDHNLEKTKQYFDYQTNMVETSGSRAELNIIENKISNYKNKINELKIKYHESNNQKIKLDHEYDKFKEIMSDIESNEQKKLVLSYIKKILDKNGLVDTLLSKNIIPYLQTSINGILNEVGHYQVNITYKNQSVNVYKDNGLNIIMSSGYESYLLDLVFRLALVQINNHIKTDFLIIDEGFNACDAENKNNIKELLEYMRSYYKWILIISHDDFVKSFYDMDIRIQSNPNGSRISNIDVQKEKSKNPKKK